MADGDSSRLEKDVGGVQSCETGGVCYAIPTKEAAQYGFEAGGVGGGFAGVDMPLGWWWEGGLRGLRGKRERGRGGANENYGS